MSISRKPGAGSCQSPKARTAMLSRNWVLIIVLRRPCLEVFRTVFNDQSMVAALMDSRLSRTVASNCKCPWRSMALTIPTITWRSRFP